MASLRYQEVFDLFMTEGLILRRTDRKYFCLGHEFKNLTQAVQWLDTYRELMTEAKGYIYNIETSNGDIALLSDEENEESFLNSGILENAVGVVYHPNGDVASFDSDSLYCFVENAPQSQVQPEPQPETQPEPQVELIRYSDGLYTTDPATYCPLSFTVRPYYMAANYSDENESAFWLNFYLYQQSVIIQQYGLGDLGKKMLREFYAKDKLKVTV